MKVNELTLYMIDSERHLTTSEEIVAAVAYAARDGWSNTTAYRFVTALVMTDNLRNYVVWPVVIRQIKDLGIAADLAALEVEGSVTGEFG